MMRLTGVGADGVPVKVGLANGAREESSVPLSAIWPATPVKVTTSPLTLVDGPVGTAAPVPVRDLPLVPMTPPAVVVTSPAAANGIVTVPVKVGLAVGAAPVTDPTGIVVENVNGKRPLP